MTDRKIVLLLRHAKSSWDVKGISDKDRPLKQRGIRQIGEIGGRLATIGIQLDKVISSPAKRALVTACGIADANDFSCKKIDICDELYFCGPDAIIELLSRQSDDQQTIMLVGHNPDLSEVLSRLCECEEEMPTCAFAAIELHEPQWKHAAKGGKLLSYEVPITHGKAGDAGKK